MVIFLAILLLLPDASVADPRAQIVGIICGDQLAQNASNNMLSFGATMDYINPQIQNSSSGTAVPIPGLDTNYGLGQCYGDILSSDCTLCYAEARTILPRCFPFNEGMTFLDGCFLRVANYSFFKEYTGLKDRVVCGNTIRRDLAFRESTIEALSQAVSVAPNNGGYASSSVTVAGIANMSVYVLANCWRTLNTSDCNICLENASASISRCLPWSEGRAMNTGCFLRYSDKFFFNAPGSIRRKSIWKSLVFIRAASGAATGILFIIGIIIGCCLRKKRTRRTSENERKNNDDTYTFKIKSIFTWYNCVILPKSFSLQKAKTQNHIKIELFLKNNENLAPRRFKYSDVKKITNSFKTKLGKGAFGSVYKGKLNDGRLVAVKILKHESKGNNGEEFMNEVASISRTSHVNIVTLIGFCFESSGRALIYEFMPNGSLEKFLCNTASSTTESRLGWEKLFEIAVGIARGLEYLHQGCNTRILHLDIKPHNILLDKDLHPKISDFGLAKLCPDRASIISMLGARGTMGYIAPEVFCRNFGEVSHKSDVYSYGMLVLEMVEGRENVKLGVKLTSDMYFPESIYKKLEMKDGDGFDGIMDREDECEIAKRKMTILGLWCIQTDPNVRPSISRVVEMLEGNLESLQIPPKPYLFSPPRITAADSSTF